MKEPYHLYLKLHIIIIIIKSIFSRVSGLNKVAFFCLFYTAHWFRSFMPIFYWLSTQLKVLKSTYMRHLPVCHLQSYIVVVEKKQKTTVEVYIAIPQDNNMREKKEHGKNENYERLKEQQEQMWKVKSKMVPLVVGTLWAVTLKLEEWLYSTVGLCPECTPRNN